MHSSSMSGLEIFVRSVHVCIHFPGICVPQVSDADAILRCACVCVCVNFCFLCWASSAIVFHARHDSCWNVLLSVYQPVVLRTPGMVASILFVGFVLQSIQQSREPCGPKHWCSWIRFAAPILKPFLGPKSGQEKVSTNCRWTSFVGHVWVQIADPKWGPHVRSKSWSQGACPSGVCPSGVCPSGVWSSRYWQSGSCRPGC